MSYSQQSFHSEQQYTYEQQITYQQQGNQKPVYQVQQTSYQTQSSSGLTVTFHSASNLKNVEKLGKQDPYVQFSYDFSDSKSFQKTFTHNDGGKSAQWNQTFQLPNTGAPDLFIEVMDKENTGSDELIGFAAIPLRQIPLGQPLSANFTIYDVKSQSAGEVQITFSTNPQQQGGQPQGQGQSYVHEGHLKRCKSLRNKGIATDVGAVAVGGALAVGAGLLGKKLYDGYKEDNQRREEEDERLKEEQERLEQEKKRLEQEKKKFEQQQQQQQQQQHQQHQQNQHRQDSDDSCHKGGHGGHHCGQHQGGGHSGAKEWDPVGTYAPGDRVEYHGRTYVCLQGHTSNPTWMPGAAHSLWQAA
ncbi:C2 domain-containing protein [Phascolomyces articulosus]|uniref:C2 domain-containing protein n=1 Tax=Phascolomyces articulosus TaxID=60185 RepID=A0AAD5K515_9FUNG|nr:C2 domain-containing protein [Phascolomyces articulosus]